MQTIAALSGASAVALGAFGAHALKSRNLSPELMDIWKTASQYHLLHSAAMLAVAVKTPKGASVPLAGKLFAAGTLIFSGSLYLLVLTEQRKLGAVTPIGGFALIGGWLACAFL